MLSASLMTINRHHMAMPLSFEAFQALHHTDYAAYARARLPAQSAGKAVEKTFTDLHSDWPAILGSPSPTRRAWELLNNHVHALTSGDRPCCRTGALRDELRTLTALGYSPERAATLTGHPLGRVCSIVRAQLRGRRDQQEQPAAALVPTE